MSLQHRLLSYPALWTHLDAQEQQEQQQREDEGDEWFDAQESFTTTITTTTTTTAPPNLQPVPHSLHEPLSLSRPPFPLNNTKGCYPLPSFIPLFPSKDSRATHLAVQIPSQAQARLHEMMAEGGGMRLTVAVTQHAQLLTHFTPDLSSSSKKGFRMSVPNQDLRLGMVLIHLLLQPSSSFTQDRQQIFASLPVLVLPLSTGFELESLFGSLIQGARKRRLQHPTLHRSVTLCTKDFDRVMGRSIAAVHKGLKEAKQPDGDEEGKEEGLGSQLRSYMSGFQLQDLKPTSPTLLLDLESYVPVTSSGDSATTKDFQDLPLTPKSPMDTPALPPSPVRRYSLSSEELSQESPQLEWRVSRRSLMGPVESLQPKDSVTARGYHSISHDVTSPPTVPALPAWYHSPPSALRQSISRRMSLSEQSQPAAAAAAAAAISRKTPLPSPPTPTRPQATWAVHRGQMPTPQPPLTTRVSPRASFPLSSSSTSPETAPSSEAMEGEAVRKPTARWLSRPSAGLSSESSIGSAGAGSGELGQARSGSQQSPQQQSQQQLSPQARERERQGLLLQAFLQPKQQQSPQDSAQRAQQVLALSAADDKAAQQQEAARSSISSDASPLTTTPPSGATSASESDRASRERERRRENLLLLLSSMSSVAPVPRFILEDQHKSRVGIVSAPTRALIYGSSRSLVATAYSGFAPICFELGFILEVADRCTATRAIAAATGAPKPNCVDPESEAVPSPGHGRPPAVLVGEDAKLLLVSLRELDQLFADQGFALLHWCLSNAASELEGRLSFDRSSE